jgi:hypothetical protein
MEIEMTNPYSHRVAVIKKDLKAAKASKFITEDECQMVELELIRAITMKKKWGR